MKLMLQGCCNFKSACHVIYILLYEFNMIGIIVMTFVHYKFCYNLEKIFVLM